MKKYLKFTFYFFAIFLHHYNTVASEFLTKEQEEKIDWHQKDLFRETKRNVIQSEYNKDYAKQTLKDNLLIIGETLKSNHNIEKAEEKVLFEAVHNTMPSSIAWKIMAKVYVSLFPDISKIIQLFETRSDILPHQTISILESHIQSFGKSEFLTFYILGIIARGDLHPKEICMALPLLKKKFLSQGDWLAIIDNVFAEPPATRDTKETFKKINIREFRDHCDGTIKLSPGVSKALKIYKAVKNALFSHVKFTKKFRSLLLKTQRPLYTDLAIVEHIGHRFPKEISIQKGLMYYWMKYLDLVNTPLSMGDLKCIMTQAHNMQNKTMITRLFSHANHQVKELPSPLRQKLIVVASQDACGDGINPETFEYFNGKQYCWFAYLSPILKELGYDVEMKCWENEDVNWEQYSCLMIGPIWGYWEWGKQEKLKKWLEQMKMREIPLINHHDIIKWIYEKTYLIRLQEAGIPVIPSLFVAKDDPRSFDTIFTLAYETFGTNDIIVKPNVGAAAKLYLHLKEGQEEQTRQHLETLKKNNKGAIIQPFCREVYDYGEISFFYVGSSLSHFYIKLCAIGSEFVQVFHGGQSHHGNKYDLSYNSEAFFEKLRAFRPDLKLTPEMLSGIFGKVHPLFFSLKKHYEQEGIVQPTFIRLDCILMNGEPHIMEVEGSNCYPEIAQAQNHSPTSKIALKYVEELIRQQTIYQTKGKYGLEDCSEEMIKNYQLGNAYYEGNGVRQDFKRAFDYWKKAADQGHREARVKVGTLFYKGEGVEKNYTKAHNYFSGTDYSENETLSIVDAEIERVQNLKEWTKVKEAYATNGDTYYRENLNIPFNKKIMFIPDEIGEFTNLKDLSFSGNLLSSIPASFNRLKNLTEISFSHNCFKYIPSEIYQLRDLTTLDFSYNCLTLFPERILTLRKLSVINLSGNRIVNIPKKIHTLYQLRILQLGDNSITSIPLQFRKCKNLKLLSLENNPIKDSKNIMRLLFKNKNNIKVKVTPYQETIFPFIPLENYFSRKVIFLMDDSRFDIDFIKEEKINEFKTRS